MPATSALDKGSQQLLPAAFVSFFQQPGAPSTLKKPSVTMAVRKACLFGKHQGHDFQ
jgi:hypothetical protein